LFFVFVNGMDADSPLFLITRKTSMRIGTGPVGRYVPSAFFSIQLDLIHRDIGSLVADTHPHVERADPPAGRRAAGGVREGGEFTGGGGSCFLSRH
jgi:hypothetical protein